MKQYIKHKPMPQSMNFFILKILSDRSSGQRGQQLAYRYYIAKKLYKVFSVFLIGTLLKAIINYVLCHSRKLLSILINLFM